MGEDQFLPYTKASFPVDLPVCASERDQNPFIQELDAVSAALSTRIHLHEQACAFLENMHQLQPSVIHYRKHHRMHYHAVIIIIITIS